MENLLDEGASGHTTVDSDWNDYDYFLCVKKDGLIQEPFVEPRKEEFFDNVDPNQDYESQDSEDSNRESAD